MDQVIEKMRERMDNAVKMATVFAEVEDKFKKVMNQAKNKGDTKALL